MLREQIKSHLWFLSILGVAMLVVLLLVAGGRFNYWQGWVYIGVNTLFLSLTHWTLRDNPSLRQERLFPGRGMKRWDQVYWLASIPLYFVSLMTASLDAGRKLWTGRLPLVVYPVAIMTYCLGQSLMLWAKRTNNFFSSVVRIQLDRGQTVCTEGPYRFVRHPGYLGGLAFGLSAPILLGSLVALIPSALAAMLLIARTLLEDNALLAELDGYKDYANAVRFRLLPHIW